MYWIELRQEPVRRGDPTVVPYDSVSEYYGSDYCFRSVYCFDEYGLEYIKSTNRTAGMDRCYLYSDTLFVDVDGGDDHVDLVGSRLMDLGVKFDYYTTGNRGGHFHIPITPMKGTYVINSQKVWLADTFPNVIDNSIYTPTGLIRLEGAIHSKTGRMKTKDVSIEGSILTIPEVKEDITIHQFDQATTTDKAHYISNLTMERGPGQRHVHMYILTKEGIALNLGLDKIVEDVLEWNYRWAKPALPAHEVIANVEKTWRRCSNE